MKIHIDSYQRNETIDFMKIPLWLSYLVDKLWIRGVTKKAYTLQRRDTTAEQQALKTYIYKYR